MEKLKRLECLYLVSNSSLGEAQSTCQGSGLLGETRREGFIMLMATVVKIMKLFFFIIDRETEKGRVFVPCT
jgi:hypothetical protein